MPLRLNSSSLTCSICALAAIIVQLVAMECQKLYMVDSPVLDSFFQRSRPSHTFVGTEIATEPLIGKFEDTTAGFRCDPDRTGAV